MCRILMVYMQEVFACICLRWSEKYQFSTHKTFLGIFLRVLSSRMVQDFRVIRNFSRRLKLNLTLLTCRDSFWLHRRLLLRSLFLFTSACARRCQSLCINFIFVFNFPPFVVSEVVGTFRWKVKWNPEKSLSLGFRFCRKTRILKMDFSDFLLPFEIINRNQWKLPFLRRNLEAQLEL